MTLGTPGQAQLNNSGLIKSYDTAAM